MCNLSSLGQVLKLPLEKTEGECWSRWGCVYSQRWLQPAGMLWRHGSVYIWTRYGPLMMMCEHLRLPIRVRENKKWKEEKKSISEGIRGLGPRLFCWHAGLPHLKSQACTHCYHTHSGAEAYLKWPYLSPSPHPLFPTVLRWENHQQLHFDSTKAINEKTISLNKVRVLFLK